MAPKWVGGFFLAILAIIIGVLFGLYAITWYIYHSTPQQTVVPCDQLTWTQDYPIARCK